MAIKDGNPKSVTGRFVFDGLGDELPPELKFERVDAEGKRFELKPGREGELTFETAFVGQRNLLEVSGPPGTDVRRFYYDFMVDRFRDRMEYVLPREGWDKFRLHYEAVSGRVESCRPMFLFDAIRRADASILHRAGLGGVADLGVIIARPELAEIVFPRLCWPVCDGTVDVYVQTCCCTFFDPGTIIIDICKIIDCDRFKKVKIPDLPQPDPGPFLRKALPEPIGPVEHAASVVESITRSLEGDPTLPGADQILELFAHHEALSYLDVRSQRAYIEAHPALQFLGCKCTMTKVASVPIQEDGTFDAFFVRPAKGKGCTQRVAYVVTQSSPSGPQVIYDGRVVPTTFALSEEAVLKVSWWARTCGRDDTIGDAGVFLNRIGATTAASLVRSVDQDGELSFAPLATTDGLVNSGANVWGGTLALRYSFHRDLRALGAKYYRVRVQRVDDNGNAVGSPTEHSTPVAWGLVQGTQIIQTALGPNPPGAPATVPNLYTIPYYVDNWDFDANSYHAFIDTSPLVSNGRYLFVVDVFDASGMRLVPSNAGAAAAGESSRAFAYQRMNPSADPAVVNLAVVPHKALSNLFRVDNTRALAAFTGLRQTRSGAVVADVLTGCQFLVGQPSDQVSMRYQAHHAAGWLNQVSISVTEGIGGPTTPLLSNTTDTGDPPATALTPAQSFAALLGSDPRCSFGATMLVTTKHTNGSGSLTNLWASAVGAFALDQTAP